VADPTGFLKYERRDAPKRAHAERLGDWREVYAELDSAIRDEQVGIQAARCMDCGVPFCHSAGSGCPLGNVVPEWNDLVRRGEWQAASESLHATNNFPEFTGKLCPAPCEAGCVLSISPLSGGPVAIKRVEETIAARAWEMGIVASHPPVISSGRSVAVVGSGPAGLAAAQQLTRAGHAVTVYERDDRLGGLLRYGIPEFKMEKKALDRRLAQLREEGTKFVTRCEVGVDLTVEQLRAEHDAVVLAVGALRGRDDTTTPGRELTGIHLAMDHLVAANRFVEGDGDPEIDARDKHVVIIGGGDTGADCYGTATRQGALSVTQLDRYPEPPVARDDARSPWPTWPYILRTYPVHEEAGQRKFALAVKEFIGDEEGAVHAVELQRVRVMENTETGLREIVAVAGETERMPADLVLLAIGFEGVEHMRLLEDLDLSLTKKGTVSCGNDWQTKQPGVFVCGDAHRGASLIVWAIAEGRSAAHAVDAYLMGCSELPDPVRPMALPLAVW
jgi:glutamate synthase (NADPH/NADH) small chain